MKTTMRLAVLGASLMCGTLSADDKRQAPAWEGTYTIIHGAKDGKEIPPEMLQGSIIKIEADKMLGTDKDKKEFFGCTYQIDKTTSPYKLTMVSTSPKKGEKAEGVIEFGKDTVKICYALPGGRTPTDFKTEAKQHYFELKKIDKGK